ncbi:MAG: DEAD/DEAH box helicase [Opitutae bacterium]|nr:DEAD/DEAH box helicase [Opitutae bacterium]
MKPEDRSKTLLGITRSKAKMFEFSVPTEHHIAPNRDPAGLFPLTLAIVGDVAGAIGRGEDISARLIEAKQELRFAAFFLDAYLKGEGDSPAKQYLTLLAAAAYYLCDLPGSAAVLASLWRGDDGHTNCRDLDVALAWLLQRKLDGAGKIAEPTYGPLVTAGAALIAAFYDHGQDEARVLAPFFELRAKAHLVGSSRELLLADLIVAVAKRRLDISARTCLPRYTALPPEKWETTLAKATFVREFWPAQRLLGEKDVFKGTSAIVQMPTSAGKTRATEILIRSAVFSGRTRLAVIVAPFRALCHEIRDSLILSFSGEGFRIDEVSDVPQDDFLLEETSAANVLILTPEKLLYLTRQKDDLAQRIGLLIYDEGHQFDTGIRGVTYELLITALKSVVPADCQVVLISAVITNAEAISSWLNGAGGSIVSGANLFPTQRSVAFASWLDHLGSLKFIAQPDSGQHTYYVPRVLESTPLAKRKKEKITRHFPTRGDEQSIGLYLALKLVAQGSVAVFCGRKSTVTKLCEILSDAYDRKLPLPVPKTFAPNPAATEEIAKLAGLVKRHYGSKGAVPHCAEMGVFTHHGATPGGVRLAVEHAMKESLVKMVICTSTLAQGVNLPIRYLIITGVYQGKKRISVRDFQNLIGRAGRAGMHTEGSIIFSDPETFDLRKTPDGKWRWGKVAELLDPSKAEDCASSLLTLFDPLVSDDGSDKANLNVEAFFHAYSASAGGPREFGQKLLPAIHDRGFSMERVVEQLERKGQIISALESFMMAAAGEIGIELSEKTATEMAHGTLAYHLATNEQRADLEALFQAITRHVAEKVPEPERRKAYAKTLFGVRNSLSIHAWTTRNTETLNSTKSDEALLEAIWPMLTLGITNHLFHKATIPVTMLELAKRWISGDSPETMLSNLRNVGVRFGHGQRPRYPDIDHVVDLCENAFGFEGVLVIAAITEALRFDGHEDAPILDRLLHLQKRLKYGAKTRQAVILHEAGFADRVVADELAEIAGPRAITKSRMRIILRSQHARVENVLAMFPSYYSFVWDKVLRGGRRKL